MCTMLIIISLTLHSDLLQPSYFTNIISFNPPDHPGKQTKQRLLDSTTNEETKDHCNFSLQSTLI